MSPLPIPPPVVLPVAAPLPVFDEIAAAPEFRNPFLSAAAPTPMWEAATVLAPILEAPVVTIADAPARPRNPSFTWEDIRLSPDPIALEKMKPETQLRRAKLAKYVKVIVCGCAALCLVALVRSAVASESDTGARAGASGAAASSVAVRQKAIVTKQIVAQNEDVVKQAPAKAIASKRARR